MVKPLRIGVFGFGQTGKLAAREVLLDPECELAWVVRREWEDRDTSVSRTLGLAGDERGDLRTLAEAKRKDFFRKNPVDCIIDFSSQSGVEIYEHAAAAGIRVVSAVSHYEEESLAKLKAMSERVSVLWSPNITVGINFVMAVGKIFRAMIPGADVQIVEEHFAAKKGVSGTALRIAAALGVDPAESISSVRAGGIVGRHEIIFGMPNQNVRLTHESVSRAVFGRGAILAAKWMRDREPGFFTMEDLMVEHIRKAAGGL
jgi:4-hydroxy-tetrahydrodipicolinate reductase